MENRQAAYLTRMRYAHAKELSRLGLFTAASGEDGVLLCLYAHRDPLLSGDVTDKTGLTSGRVANILKQLEKKQLIQRLQDAEDKRRIHVRLTSRGRTQAEALIQSLHGQYSGLLSYLGERDGSELIRLLDRCLLYARESMPGG